MDNRKTLGMAHAVIGSSHRTLSQAIVAKGISSDNVSTVRGKSDKKVDTGALQRGLAVLDAMIAAERPLSIAELSDTLGLTSSTIQRLLGSLVQARRVYQDALGRFVLTPGSVLPLGLYHPLNMLRRDARDPLRSLQEKYGATATLIIFFDTYRLILETAPGDDSFVPYFDTHLETPFHATVTGKLLLAPLSAERRNQILGAGPYQGWTANTITSEDALETELARVQAEDFAVNLDEHCPGVSATGSPIRVRPGMALGAVVLTGPSKYFTPDRLGEMAVDLTQTAHLFSHASPAVRAVCRFMGLSVM
ncbi:MAG: IclR family transcriptional regulator [Pusillimonas sp.]